MPALYKVLCGRHIARRQTMFFLGAPDVRKMMAEISAWTGHNIFCG
jgi:hypothetical protein